MKPEVRLETLLLSLFTSDELVRWLRNFVDAKLVDEIPVGNTTPTHLVHQTILALQRRGLINESFFQGLIAERPGRSADIQLAAKWWLDHPKHFLLSPYQSYLNDGRSYRYNTYSFPSSCICIMLHSSLSDGHLNRDVDAAVFDASTSSLLLGMLDALYTNYLRDRFSPLSYGREWFLARSQRALLPWEWLVDARAGKFEEIPPRWAATRCLADFEILPGAVLEVVDLRRMKPQAQRRVYGLAVNSDQMRSFWEWSSKAHRILAAESLLVEAVPESVAPDKFKYAGIYFKEDDDWAEEPDLGAWIQAREPTAEEIQEWGDLLEALRLFNQEIGFGP